MNDSQKLNLFLYDMEDKKALAQEIAKIDDSYFIHEYMKLYNWDDGFEIPQIIVNNACCQLSTALMAFYDAGGEEYLFEKDEMRGNNSDWYRFVHSLYKRIKRGEFYKGNIYYEPPLNKLKIYKLKKILSKQEMVFINACGEKV